MGRLRRENQINQESLILEFKSSEVMIKFKGWPQGRDWGGEDGYWKRGGQRTEGRFWMGHVARCHHDGWRLWLEGRRAEELFNCTFKEQWPLRASRERRGRGQELEQRGCRPQLQPLKWVPWGRRSSFMWSGRRRSGGPGELSSAKGERRSLSTRQRSTCDGGGGRNGGRWVPRGGSP